MVDERKLPALPQPFGYIDSDGGFTPADSDDRYSMGDVFTANQMRAYAIEAAEQRVREVEADARIGDVVWHYIDRMNDVCPEDPAEKIIEDFTSAVWPIMLAHLRQRGAVIHDVAAIAKDAAEQGKGEGS